MNRMLVALVGVLACIASVTPAEPPQGPWQSLTPSLGTPEEAPVHHKDEIALTPDEEFLVSNMQHFKLPFKLDKKQTAVAMKLLKEAVKPVIKSKTLQDSVAYVDDLLSYIVEDRDTQMYMTLFFDFMQDVYEGKQAERVDKIVRGLIHDNSDEFTARSMNDMWSYVSSPVNRMILSPVRNYLVKPLSSAVSRMAEEFDYWIGRRSWNAPGNSYDPYENEYDSWSNNALERFQTLNHYSKLARSSLSYAADVLEAQDQARHDYHHVPAEV